MWKYIVLLRYFRHPNIGFYPNSPIFKSGYRRTLEVSFRGRGLKNRLCKHVRTLNWCRTWFIQVYICGLFHIKHCMIFRLILKGSWKYNKLKYLKMPIFHTLNSEILRKNHRRILMAFDQCSEIKDIKFYKFFCLSLKIHFCENTPLKHRIL